MQDICLFEVIARLWISDMDHLIMISDAFILCITSINTEKCKSIAIWCNVGEMWLLLVYQRISVIRVTCILKHFNMFEMRNTITRHILKHINRVLSSVWYSQKAYHIKQLIFLVDLCVVTLTSKREL